MKHWEIEFVDRWTNGKVSKTYLCGYETEEEVVKFLGLDQEDVSYYKVKQIDKSIFDEI